MNKESDTIETNQTSNFATTIPEYCEQTLQASATLQQIQETLASPRNSVILGDQDELSLHLEQENDDVDLSKSLEAAIQQIPTEQDDEDGLGNLTNFSQPDSSFRNLSSKNITKNDDSDSLMSRIQNLLHISKEQNKTNQSLNLSQQSINEIDKSLSALDTEKRLIELKNLASIVDKQFSELLKATDPEEKKLRAIARAESRASNNSRSCSRSKSRQSGRSKTPALNKIDSFNSPNLPLGPNPIAQSTINTTGPLRLETSASPIKKDDGHSISTLSVTFSEREREIDALLSRIKKRNEHLEKKVVSLSQTDLQKNFENSQNSQNTQNPNRSNSSLSQDSLGKKVDTILDSKISTLNMNQLAEGAQILNNLLNSARNSKTASEVGGTTAQQRPSDPQSSLGNRVRNHLANSKNHVYSDSDTSSLNSFKIQRQLMAFENSPMWKYVKNFLPGCKLEAGDFVQDTSSFDSEEPKRVEKIRVNETKHQKNEPSTARTASNSGQSSKQQFLTSTASPTPVKPESKINFSQPNNTGLAAKVLAAHGLPGLPPMPGPAVHPQHHNLSASTISVANESIPRKDLFKMDLNDSNSNCSVHMSLPVNTGHTNPPMIPMEHTMAAMHNLNQNDSSRNTLHTQDQLSISQPVTFQSKKSEASSVAISNSNSSINSSNLAHKIPSLAEFRKMTSSQQKETMAQLRNIRINRSKQESVKQKNQNKYKSVPGLDSSNNSELSESTRQKLEILKKKHEIGAGDNTTISTTSGSTLTNLSNTQLPIAADTHPSFVKNPNKQRKQEKRVQKLQKENQKQAEERDTKQPQQDPSSRSVKTIVHDITAESGMDTSASEVIHIIHRSKRTGIEKSVETKKSRGTGMGESFLNSQGQKNGPNEENELNSSTETVTVAKGGVPIEILKNTQQILVAETATQIDPHWDVRPPPPVTNPICWFDTLEGNMRTEESKILDSRPIKETVSLQERFLLYNRKFISKSRGRARKIDIMREERQLEKIWDDQRQHLKADKENLGTGPVVIMPKSSVMMKTKRNLSPVLQARREVFANYGRARSPSPKRKTNAKVEKKLQTLVRGQVRAVKAFFVRFLQMWYLAF